MEDVSGHEKREQKRLEREQAEKQKEQAIESKQRNKNYISIGITVLVIVAFAVGIWYLMSNKKEMYTDREIHWHALVDITICGQHRDLPKAESADTVHGKSYRGIHLIHTHDDNIMHIEGVIQKKEDIALGRFFDVIEVPFDKDKIMDVKNGDLCDGKPGTLKMYVNGQPRQDFRDYVAFATEDARKQVIKLVFEPEQSTNST